MMPVGAWEYITKDFMSHATSSAEARRLRRASTPWARLTIDRYGRLHLPMQLRRRGGIGRKVTLQLINEILELRPEPEFENALEWVRWTNAELETSFHALTAEPIAAHSQAGPRARRQVPSKSRDRADRIPHLAADELEAFVRDCFWQMGFRCVQVGRTRQADGGVDLIVCSPPFYPFPHLLAVQVKGHAGPRRRTPSRMIRDFVGAIQAQPVTGGVFIINSKFTEDAHDFAKRHKHMLWLRDIDDLARWSRGDFRPRQFNAEVESALELRKGVSFSVTRGRIHRQW
jgi:hypothetical protein